MGRNARGQHPGGLIDEYCRSHKQGQKKHQGRFVGHDFPKPVAYRSCFTKPPIALTSSSDTGNLGSLEGLFCGAPSLPTILSEWFMPSTISTRASGRALPSASASATPT